VARRLTVTVVAVVMVTALSSWWPTPATTIDRNRGVDISWPECPRSVGIRHRMGQAKPMPVASTGFVVLGLTNGPGFHVNPCIDTELAFIRRYRLPVAAYAMTTYPTASDLATWGRSGPYATNTTLGRLSNTGYREALFNVVTMRSKGIKVPFVWIDIEAYCPWCWTTSLAANNAVVTGVMRGYQRSGYKVGFYSSTYMWNKILGAAGPKRYPEWRTAGATSWASAARMCTHGGFAGGKAVLGQWWTAAKDYDQVCPTFATTTSRRGFFGHA
jgi:hypothetical protein